MYPIGFKIVMTNPLDTLLEIATDECLLRVENIGRMNRGDFEEWPEETQREYLYYWGLIDTARDIRNEKRFIDSAIDLLLSLEMAKR